MSATVATFYFNTATPGAGNNISPNPLRFKLADNNAWDAANPCVVPAAGVTLSWWKAIKLVATVAPDTAINNVFIYCDGSIDWTGCILYIGYDGGDYGIAGYSQAITGGPSTGAEMVVNYSGVASRVDIDTLTAASPGSVSGSIGYIIGNISDYVVMQVEIDNTAGPGEMPDEILTWRFDET